MKKNFIFLVLLLCVFLVSSCRSDETTSTPVEKKTTESPQPQEEFATIEIVAQGRTSYENIEVAIFIAENVSLPFVSLQNNGQSAKINVKEYIGKTLRVEAFEKYADGTKKKVSKTVDVTIEKNKVNTVKLEIEAKKIYDADIKVYKNDAPLPRVKVYAINSTESHLLSLVNVSGSSALSGKLNVTTGKDGIAKFSNLSTKLGEKYIFLVVTREPVVGSGIKGEYQRVDLVLDGTKKEGTITISSTVFSVNITSSENLNGVTVGLYPNEQSAAYNILPTYYVVLGDGKTTVDFENIMQGDYFLRVFNNENCITSDIIPITVERNKSGVKNVTVERKTELTLRNASPNPYNVKLVNSKGSEVIFKMEGNSRNKVLLPLGSTSVEVTQISGYLIYPTKEKYNKNLQCGVTNALCFPEDRCK